MFVCIHVCVCVCRLSRVKKGTSLVYAAAGGCFRGLSGDIKAS